MPVKKMPHRGSRSERRRAPATLALARVSSNVGQSRAFLGTGRKISPKPGDWTDDQFTTILTSNAQGTRWADVSKDSVRKLVREWRRTDGAIAIWQMGVGMSVTNPAYQRAKDKAEANAKADAARLPKILKAEPINQPQRGQANAEKTLNREPGTLNLDLRQKVADEGFFFFEFGFGHGDF
jgi:hypothetical protein